MRLNREQEDAAKFLHGVCAVIAVPGSGKTLTMTHRIARLVTEHGIAPENILGLTFTRNAAQAMRDKLREVMEEAAERVMLSTIHGFCHYLLKRQGRTYEILSGKEQLQFIAKVMKQLRVKDLSTGTVLREISLAKNNLISQDELRSLFEGDKSMQKVADIYELYDREKLNRLMLDFDDLLLEVYRLLSERDELRERFRETYRHVLVDEFQDTNPIQMEILKTLSDGANADSSFWVCGDDWQSIYAFNGASVGNILNFKRTFAQSRTFILNLNYRSTPQILKACQNLISYNTRKIEKTLRTENQTGEDVIIVESSSEEGEAIALVNELADLLARNRFSFKDMAVLYRANFQSRVVEEVFSQHKIPYHIENGLGFYHRPEIRVLLNYMRLILEFDSDEGDEALLNVINVPNRYLGRKFVNELTSFSNSRDIHYYLGLKSMPVELTYLRKNVRTLIELIDPLIEEREKLQPSELIQILRNALDYDRFVTDSDIPSPDDVKIQNIDQLQLSASRFTDLSSFLAYTDTFEDHSVQDKEGVSLMTIHKAKGLEFPVVFVIGLVEGILPSKRGDIEEERRICFVGMSRAMKILYLTHSRTYLGQPSKKSIFLNEILGKS
jgi:DNA helicase-2/ATP-dependent DNA helicase PcrA